jgi:hypothetical protein
MDVARPTSTRLAQKSSNAPPASFPSPVIARLDRAIQ